MATFLRSPSLLGVGLDSHSHSPSPQNSAEDRLFSSYNSDEEDDAGFLFVTTEDEEVDEEADCKSPFYATSIPPYPLITPKFIRLLYHSRLRCPQ
jgi:hypothetical protein